MRYPGLATEFGAGSGKSVWETLISVSTQPNEPYSLIEVELFQVVWLPVTTSTGRREPCPPLGETGPVGVWPS